MSIKSKIKPEDIQLTQYWDTFGNLETEASAYWVVAFLTERGRGWAPFTFEEINDFYQQRYERAGRRRFSFNRLLAGHMTARTFPYGEARYHEGFIDEADGLYIVTDVFVATLAAKWCKPCPEPTQEQATP